jgi:hypothetical protein
MRACNLIRLLVAESARQAEALPCLPFFNMAGQSSIRP